MPAGLITALSAGQYLHWGVINISLTNLAIIVVMIIVFWAAVLVPFPHRGDRQEVRHEARGDRP